MQFIAFPKTCVWIHCMWVIQNAGTKGRCHVIIETSCKCQHIKKLLNGNSIMKSQVEVCSVINAE